MKNPVLWDTIVFLEKKKTRFWKSVAEKLRTPRRQKVEVNVGKIDKLAKKMGLHFVVVPGKVLGGGNITVPVTVAAFAFSESAKKKILEAGGKIMSLKEAAEKNPEGKGLTVIT